MLRFTSSLGGMKARYTYNKQWHATSLEDALSTGLFINPSGISELDCATTKIDTAERSISIGRESLQIFLVLGALAYFQVPPLGGSREEKWRSQWIRKCSVSWNLPKLSRDCATEVSDHVPHRTTYWQNNSWMVHEFQQSGCLCAAKRTGRPGPWSTTNYPKLTMRFHSNNQITSWCCHMSETLYVYTSTSHHHHHHSSIHNWGYQLLYLKMTIRNIKNT